MTKNRLIPLSKVRPTVEMDTVAASKQWGGRRAFSVLMEAQQHWSNMSRFRLDRERNKRYTYGDQWGDIISVDGEFITEEEFIKKQGNVPLKNNLVRRLVRNVLGVYRSQAKEPTCTARDRDEQRLGETMSTILQCNMQVNRLQEVYARSMEEFLISGFIMHRKWYGWRNDRLDCWTDYVNPNNLFVDGNMRDFRGWDVSCIGEVHDISFETLCGQFASSPEDYRKLSEIYTQARNKELLSSTCKEFGYSLKTHDFLLTNDPSRCRVIEVWRKESKPRYRCVDYNTGEIYKIDIEDYEEMVESVNLDRLNRGIAVGMSADDIPLIQAEWFMDEYWYFYYLTPFGDILKEGETPYSHKSHPYVFKAYPFIDGEVHSFVGDVIDQQRYTNRLITLYDWIMRASAKGVLLFPEECLPKGMDIRDIADEWSRFNGVIAIKTKETAQVPQQIANNSTNIGITELLNIQLKFFEDISGVNGALQGKPGYSGMSGTLYAQQTQNATTSLLDLLDSFSMFVIDAAYKDVKNMQQFYDTKRVFNIAGKSASSIEYDPQSMQDVEFDLSIVESTTTPAYRQMANDFLMEIWRSNQISLQQLLQCGDFAFADELLQSLQSQQEQIEQGLAPDAISPELLSQVAQKADMDAVNKAYGMLKPAQAA
ncbi:MAG: hypothetical protein IIX79_05185 [Alistipes sp.]|nr:hypothetical protein [Alistipes sp.]MBQ1981079.1 hypothetical protein [Alistipes sp.]MBQ5914560.1 hypothetical protein [Alistipes sp.]